jgi:small neutral amino acid transporter SnatA (MarC family)
MSGLIIGFLGFRKLFPSEGSPEKGDRRWKIAIPFGSLAIPSLSGPGAIILFPSSVWERTSANVHFAI